MLSGCADVADCNYRRGMGVHGVVVEQASWGLAGCGHADYAYYHSFNGTLGTDWEGDEGDVVRSEK